MVKPLQMTTLALLEIKSDQSRGSDWLQNLSFFQNSAISRSASGQKEIKLSRELKQVEFK